MSISSSYSSAILAQQAPLLNLAYTLTGNRDDAYALLRDTTRRAMSAPAAFTTRDSLFAVMRTIFDSAYSARAAKRRQQVSARAYAIPSHAVAHHDADDTIPQGTHTVSQITGAIASLRDRRHSYALSMRAAGYRYSEIARAEGVSTLRIRLRVALAAISLRALLA
ncbi:MAG: hypothetical protein NC342_08365 [Pseudoflavonifractor sp.]|nr:hypothetical protein [Alloprevotella sp.]MCM1117534.1 hypothetical protein [Pseudoflavonifractor sp.]